MFEKATIYKPKSKVANYLHFFQKCLGISSQGLERRMPKYEIKQEQAGQAGQSEMKKVKLTEKNLIVDIQSCIFDPIIMKWTF